MVHYNPISMSAFSRGVTAKGRITLFI